MQTDAIAAYLDARVKTVSRDTPSEEVNALRTDIEQFLQQHPLSFLRGKLEQSIFTLLTNAEDTQALAKLTPNNLETQIAVLTAKYQIEAANTSQTTENQSTTRINRLFCLNMNSFGSTMLNFLMMLSYGRLGIHKVDALKRKSIKKRKCFLVKMTRKVSKYSLKN